MIVIRPYRQVSKACEQQDYSPFDGILM